MPVYCFRNADNEPVELFMTISEMSSRSRDDMSILHEGETLKRDKAAELRGFADTNDKGWPLISEGAGTHPSEIAATQELLQKKGVSCDYTPDGRPVMRDPRHRKRVLKALGYYDRETYA